MATNPAKGTHRHDDRDRTGTPAGAGAADPFQQPGTPDRGQYSPQKPTNNGSALFSFVLPADLQSAMSLEAQAERERSARIILAEAEEEIAELMREAGKAYDQSAAALAIRSLHLQYESVRKSGGTVVTVPSALSDAFK